jgi:hypothetical protein
MMREIAIIAYRPKQGKYDDLLALTREHHRILHDEGLVTDRPAIITRSRDGTLVEIFEWEDGAVERAHSNASVLQLWKRYEALCDYVPLASLAESANIFAGFEALN